MNKLTRNFINRFQGDFPVEEFPYARVASELGCDTRSLLSLIKTLLDEGTLSRFGPLFDAASMGGSLTLCALSVPEERYDEVTETVNGIPEVAHNYQREHELNMWFVIATETAESMQQTLEKIEQQTGLTLYNFPKIQTFYLGLWIVMDEADNVSTQPVPGPLRQGGMVIDQLGRDIVKASQAGLPLVPDPYREIAQICQCDTQTVLQRMQEMLSTGVIRRIGAVPNHYRLGLRANGMSVWNVDDALLNEFGPQIGRLDFVSHSYERPRHAPFWPYNLFAMVHGHDREEVMGKVSQIESLLGSACSQHDVLFSTKILKKTGLRLVA